MKMIFDLDLFGKTYFLIPKKLLRRAIERYAHHIRGSVLDVGCGQKPYRYLFQTDHYIGMDRNIEVNPDIVATSQCFPFKKRIFDNIVCFETLEHIKSPEKCLRNLQRVLKKEGKLLLTVPFEWPLHYEPHDYWRFTPYSLKILLTKAGFKIQKIDRIGGLFAVIGSRFVDVFSRKLEKAIPIRNPFKFMIVAVVFHPISLLFYGLSKVFDRIDDKDAFGWIVLADRKV